MAMSNTITRRSFLKGAALTGAAATVATMAGCDGDTAATNEDGSVKKILRFGQSNAKVGLDM